MAWYGSRRSGERRDGARAAVVGLGLAMLGVLAIQTSSVVRSSIEGSRRSMDGMTANLASFATGIASWQIGFGADKAAQEEIKRLRERLAEQEQWKTLAETQTLRMESYERLLDLMGETPSKAVMARVVADSDGPFAATVIANAGAEQGVKEGYAAVNGNGLVGRVVRVGERTSRVLLVTDFRSRIPVMGGQSQDRALLIGDRDGGARLTYPETPERIVEGETWYTSGDDGQIPAGIKVGRAHLVDGEWRVRLSMTDGHVDYVRLIPQPDFPRPEDNPAKVEPPKPPAASPTPAATSTPRPRPTTTPAVQASPTATPQPTPGANGQPNGQGGRR